MCRHGTYKTVSLVNGFIVKVDACIADEVQWLNDKGVVTLSSCCGHGEAGQIVEWENAFGKWKSIASPPMVLISRRSIELARSLGYRPFPYYYADGQHNGVFQMYLKTGCLTSEEVTRWHETK